MKYIFAAVLVFIALAEAKFSYDNYKVYKVVPNSAEQVTRLKGLEIQGYDFWTDIYEVGSDVRIMVSPAQDAGFAQFTKSVGLTPTVAISNVQDLINAQLIPAESTRSARLLSHSWDRYYNIDEIHKWLDELVETYPNYVETVTIGQSFESRPIKGVVIDFKRGQRGEKPLTGMIEGGIHAREWISPATVTWIIKEFLTSEEEDIRLMAETFVWHIFPVVNPDGYAYTWDGMRMWRKNRNPTNFVTCANNDMGNGIDLNRNFNFVWNTEGASSNPCDNTYAGPTPASELEAQAIQNYVLELKENSDMIYYFAFHSYSQMILVPYSHLSGTHPDRPENYNNLYSIAIAGAEKLEARHGTHYRVGTSVDILYTVTGSSFDWVKGVADVPIVYLFELRDTAEYGFLLPTEQIVGNSEEIMDCLVEMEKRTRALNYYEISGASNIVTSTLSLALGIIAVALLR